MGNIIIGVSHQTEQVNCLEYYIKIKSESYDELTNLLDSKHELETVRETALVHINPEMELNRFYHVHLAHLCEQVSNTLI
jgi:hypothetical protein